MQIKKMFNELKIEIQNKSFKSDSLKSLLTQAYHENDAE